MSINRINDMYKDLVSASDESENIGSLRYYNSKSGLIRQILSDRTLPPFCAMYNGTNIPAVYIEINTRGSVEGFLLSRPDGEGKQRYLKKSWCILSESDYLSFASGLHKYIELTGVKDPDIDSMIEHIGPVNHIDEFEFEQSLSVAAIKNKKHKRKYGRKS